MVSVGMREHGRPSIKMTAGGQSGLSPVLLSSSFGLVARHAPSMPSKARSGLEPVNPSAAATNALEGCACAGACVCMRVCIVAYICAYAIYVRLRIYVYVYTSECARAGGE